jgi:hypothetical protein
MPRNNRSAVSNGTRLGIDLRSKDGRRWRDIYAAAMEATHARHESLCRQLATLTIRREQLDAQVAAGRDVDIDLLLRLSSEVRRTQERLGLLDAGDDEPDLLPHDAPLWMVGERASAPEEAA